MTYLSNQLSSVYTYIGFCLKNFTQRFFVLSLSHNNFSDSVGLLRKSRAACFMMSDMYQAIFSYILILLSFP